MINSPLEDQKQKMDNPKLQIAESLKKANNVLVTVSNNPSVDQLAAAIGLTLLLNKMGKHSTAVFSGAVPSIIEFLEPEKTLEKNADSLRDFIIALDKAKADKLRYKVEDKLVKIFITPYHTSIDQADLEFSQGDFNVDAVVALGVKQREQLDQAITSHGRILHNAAIISVNIDGSGNIGTQNWVDPAASSLCEMIVSIIDLMTDKNPLDRQMSTAFLTGIVAQTDRFSNARTSGETMTISAKLINGGANQQLVADKLEPALLQNPAMVQKPVDQVTGSDEVMGDDGSMTIDHSKDKASIPKTKGSAEQDYDSEKIDHNEPALKSPIDVPAPPAKMVIQPPPPVMPPVMPPMPQPQTVLPPQPPLLPPRPPLPHVQPRANSSPYLIRPLPWQDPVQAATDTVPEGMAGAAEPSSLAPQSKTPILSHNETTQQKHEEPVPDKPAKTPTAPVVIGTNGMPFLPGGTPAVDPNADPPTLEELEEYVRSPHLMKGQPDSPYDGNQLSPAIPTPYMYVANNPHQSNQTNNSEPILPPLPSLPAPSATPSAPVEYQSSAAPILPPIEALNAAPVDLNFGHDGSSGSSGEGDLPSVTVDSATGVPIFNTPPPAASSKPADSPGVGSPPAVPPPMMPPIK